jgi:hypothetical protein
MFTLLSTWESSRLGVSLDPQGLEDFSQAQAMRPKARRLTQHGGSSVLVTLKETGLTTMFTLLSTWESSRLGVSLDPQAGGYKEMSSILADH